MSEDSHDPPLPQRVRGDTHGPPGPPVAPLALPEPVVQQILSTLDAAKAAAQRNPPGRAEQPAQEHTAPAAGPPSLPRRVPGTSYGRKPPAQISRPVLPASLPGFQPREAAAAQPKPAQPKPALPKPALPKPALPQARVGRHRGIIRLVILVVVVVLAGPLALVLARHVTTAAGNGDRTRTGAESATRNLAAAWAASQVSRAAIVSCDLVMCQALQAHGVPAASLLELRPGRADPLDSSVIVATAAVRSMIGNRLVAADAPAAIASFGSGSTRIDIREIAPQGTARYVSALRADMQARKTSGTELLNNRQIMASATARSQLAGGKVDSRLLVVIAGLAAQRPFSIVAFGGLAHGASPGIPLRSVDLAETAGTAGPHGVTWVRLMVTFLRAQREPYLAAHIRTLRLAGSQNILRIEFAAPSPLGLLGQRAPRRWPGSVSRREGGGAGSGD
jgi:hypothetical protein